jgi:hypothetical protein
MPSPAADLIVLDTLGKLADHGYGIGGYCLACRRLFNVSLTVLMLERGRDCSPIGMAQLRWPAHAIQYHGAEQGPRLGFGRHVA